MGSGAHLDDAVFEQDEVLDVAVERKGEHEDDVEDKVQRGGFDEHCGDRSVCDCVLWAEHGPDTIARGEEPGGDEDGEEEVERAGEHKVRQLDLQVEEDCVVLGEDHHGDGERWGRTSVFQDQPSEWTKCIDLPTMARYTVLMRITTSIW